MLTVMATDPGYHGDCLGCIEERQLVERDVYVGCLKEAGCMLLYETECVAHSNMNGPRMERKFLEVSDWCRVVFIPFVYTSIQY